jgi:hypothetical protein
MSVYVKDESIRPATRDDRKSLPDMTSYPGVAAIGIIQEAFAARGI